jgi:hypothetical protein
MKIRNIAVLGGFAAGAALTLAPLASADTPIDPTILSGEITSLNSIFLSDATLAGDAADVVTHTGSFDTIPLSFAPDTGTPTFLDYELYGLNPIANAAGDPGSYNVLNGALTEFDDAYNVELYSLANPDAAVSAIPLDDLFGSSTNITAALAETTFSAAIGDFVTNGFNDLLGYL